MAGKERGPDDSRESGARQPRALLFGLAHPVRAGFMTRAARERLSPKEYADEIGSSPSLVSYHVRVLKECGLVELVGTRQRRGATQHFYRADLSSLVAGPLGECIPEEARNALSDDQLVQMLMRLASFNPELDAGAA